MESSKEYLNKLETKFQVQAQSLIIKSHIQRGKIQFWTVTKFVMGH